MAKIKIINNTTQEINYVSLGEVDIDSSSPSIKLNNKYVSLSENKKKVSLYPTISFNKNNKIYYPVEEYLPIGTNILIYSEETVDSFLSEYIPSSFLEIFNTWDRFNHNDYFPGGVDATGEATSWFYNETTEAVECSINSTYATGFTSLDTFYDYEHTATLSSTNTDDDYILIVIAYARIDDVSHILAVARTGGGIFNYTAHPEGLPFLCRDGGEDLGTGNHSGENRGVSIAYLSNNNIGYPIKNASGLNCAQSGGFKSLGESTVKISKVGTQITIKCSAFGSADYDAGETITIDTNDYSELWWCEEPTAYGYATWSQPNTTFSDITFESVSNDPNTVYVYGESGDVWRYSNGTWSVTGEKVWDVLGYPRYVISKDGVTYKVLNGSFEKVE